MEIVLNVSHSRGIASVAFSLDGSCALSGSHDHILKLWNVATGKLLRTFEGHIGDVISVALSLDGSRVLSGGEDNTRSLRIWWADKSHL